jgi:hypothetical protein
MENVREEEEGEQEIRIEDNISDIRTDTLDKLLEETERQYEARQEKETFKKEMREFTTWKEMKKKEQVMRDRLIAEKLRQEEENTEQRRIREEEERIIREQRNRDLGEEYDRPTTRDIRELFDRRIRNQQERREQDDYEWELEQARERKRIAQHEREQAECEKAQSHGDGRRRYINDISSIHSAASEETVIVSKEEFDERVKRKVEEALAKEKRTTIVTDMGEKTCESIEGRINNKVLMERRRPSLRDMLTMVSASVPVFKGEAGENVITFLRQLDFALRGFEITSDELHRIVIGRLEGNALRWYHNIVLPGKEVNISSILEDFRKEYLNEETRTQASEELRILVNTGQGNTVVDKFYNDFAQLMEIGIPQPDSVLAGLFINGLREDIRVGVRAVQATKGRFQTLRDAYQCAKRMESITREERHTKKAGHVLNAERENCHEQTEELIRIKRELQMTKEQMERHLAQDRYEW